MLDFNLSFIWIRFLIVFSVTALSFLWLKRRSSRLEQLYYIFFIVFVFVYSGVGSGWADTPSEYLFKYCVYIFVLGFVCQITIGKDRCNLEPSTSEKKKRLLIMRLISNYGRAIILVYILIPLLSLVLAGKVENLISPPSLNLQDALDAGNNGGSKGMVDSILYYVHQLILPFYLLSLYKYKDDILKLSVALIAPLYITFASSGYISRSGTLPFLIIIFLAFYIKYPRYRKKMMIGTMALLPAFLFALSWFTFVRLGKEINISYSDAISLLAYQETSYPEHYVEIQKWPFDGHLLYTYLDWFIKLPLPGFLKSTNLDYAFNAIFTEKLTGATRTDMYFSISLPGLVGEGVFLFGKSFYWIHAIIVGWVISMAYRLVHHKQELFLVLYMCVYASVGFARGGTVSILPFYFKHLIIYLIVIYFVTKTSPAK